MSTVFNEGYEVWCEEENATVLLFTTKLMEAIEEAKEASLKFYPNQVVSIRKAREEVYVPETEEDRKDWGTDPKGWETVEIDSYEHLEDWYNGFLDPRCENYEG